MAAKAFFLPRKCIVHCELFHPATVADAALNAVHYSCDCITSIVSTTTVVVAYNLERLVALVRDNAKEYGFDRLSIVDHGGAKIDKATGALTGIKMQVGDDILTAANISTYGKHLAKLDDALTKDAVVKVVNCFIAADSTLHRALAKYINRPVIAGLGATDLFGGANEKGFYRCDPAGFITSVGEYSG